jgi:putative phosphoesterase
MILAVMSDSHDHRKPLETAVKRAAQEGAQALFHLGDLISPFMLGVIKDFPGRIYLVIGNNDGDVLTVARTIPQECPQVREYAHKITVDLDDVRVAAMHNPDFARSIAACGDFQIVLYGHTHKFDERRIGETLLLNPGDLMGFSGESSFCLVDTETLDVKRLFV